VPTVSPTTEVAVAAGLPVTVKPVQLPQLGNTLTVYLVMISPLPVGAVQVRPTDPSGLGVATKAVGVPGTPSSITAFDAADAAPVPITLVAVTVKVYEVPTVSPTTVAGLLVGVTPVHPEHAGDGITV
jgi:hypothetical protein